MGDKLAILAAFLFLLWLMRRGQAGGQLAGSDPDPCLTTYENFRSKTVPSYYEAAGEMFRESKRFAAKGDYSKPASRRAILGRMHEYKLAAWEQHQRDCEQAADEAARIEAIEVPF